MQFILVSPYFSAVLNDDKIRTSLLEVVTAPLCSHIIESQMISNTVVTYVGQPAIQRNGSLPEWW